MIESTAALSTIASAIAASVTPTDGNVRASTTDQTRAYADRSANEAVVRYFRFNLKYDAADKQLYFVFKNQVTGAVVAQAPSARSVRAANESAPGPLGGGGAAEAPVRSQAAASTSDSARTREPKTQPAAGAPAVGGSASGEVERGAAVDSRI